MKIKGAVVKEKGADFEIIDGIELHELGPTDLRIHMVASGICHSDEELRKGDNRPYPAILGHEGAGIVESIGKDVVGFEVGDQVLLTFYADGTCRKCLQGKAAECLNFGKNNIIGTRPDGDALFTLDGENIATLYNQSSFTTTTVVNQRNAVKVDKDLDLRILAPLTCGYMTGAGTVFNSIQPKPGDTMAIFGTGAVGIGALLAGKIVGCSKVIAVDIVPERLELAKELGATHTINSKEVDPVAAIKEITDGLGVDLAVDTTGVAAVMANSIDVLGVGGKTTLIAVTSKSIEVYPGALLGGSKSIMSILMGGATPQIDLPRLVDYYRAGKFPIDKTIKYYDFEQINEANRDSNTGKTIKPVLVIDKTYQPGL